MSNTRKEINVARLREIFADNPRKKKDVCEALGFDRQTISKILNHVRRIEGGELLTIADVCGVDPRDLSLQ